MNWWVVGGIAAWLACSRIVYRVLLVDHYRKFKRVTRGDVAFICYLAAHGPVALPVAFLVYTGNSLSRFWSKQVWPKDHQTFLHD